MSQILNFEVLKPDSVRRVLIEWSNGVAHWELWCLCRCEGETKHKTSADPRSARVNHDAVIEAPILTSIFGVFVLDVMFCCDGLYVYMWIYYSGFLFYCSFTLNSDWSSITLLLNVEWAIQLEHILASEL